MQGYCAGEAAAAFGVGEAGTGTAGVMTVAGLLGAAATTGMAGETADGVRAGKATARVSRLARTEGRVSRRPLAAAMIWAWVRSVFPSSALLVAKTRAVWRWWLARARRVDHRLGQGL